MLRKARTKAKARSSAHSPKLPRFVARASIQYLAIFIAGSLAPFVGGLLAGLVSSSVWSLSAAQFNDYNPATLAVINSILFASVVVGYLACFGVLAWLYRCLGGQVTFRNTAYALIPAGALALLGALLPYHLYDVGANALVWLDIISMIIFGLGYVVGWWTVRRSHKLGK